MCYWHRGELLALPGELVGQVEQERLRAEQERQQRLTAEAEVERLRVLLGQGRHKQSRKGG